MRRLTILLIAAILWSGTSGYCAEPAPKDPLDIEQLKQRYPNARFRQVTLEEFERMQDQLPAGAVVIKAPSVAGQQAKQPAGQTNKVDVILVTTNAPAVAPAARPHQGHPPRPVPNPHRTPPPARVDATVDHSCTAAFDLFSGIGHADADEIAVVVFVVVGVVVVAALVVYGGVYLTNMALGIGDYEYWWNLETHASWLVGHRDSGTLVGARLSTGFVESGVQVGLAAEAGYLDVDSDLRDKKRPPVEFKGVYGLIGPAVRWMFGPGEDEGYAYAEVLAGTTEHRESKLLSVARCGVNWSIGSRMRLGLSVGSMYMDLDASEGVVQEGDNFALLLGGNAGIRF